MERQIVLVDMDGVLANYNASLIAIAKERFPTVPTPQTDSLIHFETSLHWPLQYQDRVDLIALEPGFFSGLAPIEGAVEGFHALAARFDVWICTAPKRTFTHCVPEKYSWVKHYLGQRAVERIVMTRDKTLVRGHYLIDDKPLITGANTPVWEHVVFDQPYNRHVRERRRVNWQTIMEVLS